MKNDSLVAVILLLALLLIVVVFIIDAYFKFKKSTTIALKVAKQTPQWKKVKQILEDNFVYYQNLPDQLKEDFIFRTYKFMRFRQWIPSSKLIVDLHKKVLISASATQLTFGLTDFSFGRFKTILIHNDAYYNRLTKQYHRGEVNQAGLIVLSWKHFEEGYAIDNDKINLGLHEMAHALDLAIHLSEGRQYKLQRLIEKFQQSAFEEILKMRTSDDRFFRTYGSTNVKEFFSVAVEHFFEAPFEFKDRLPNLYIEICQLLNQDPCNKIYQGYKSPNSYLYDNLIKNKNSNFIKPKIKLNPNINLAIPFASISLMVALTIPVLSTFINNWTSPIIAGYGTFYLCALYITYFLKAKQLSILENHLYSINYLLKNDIFSVHLKNIVRINFTYMLSYYQTTISYFEGEKICDKKLSLYYSPASIKKLERYLLQQSINIKHNNKWLKKEGF